MSMTISSSVHPHVSNTCLGQTAPCAASICMYLHAYTQFYTCIYAHVYALRFISASTRPIYNFETQASLCRIYTHAYTHFNTRVCTCVWVYVCRHSRTCAMSYLCYVLYACLAHVRTHIYTPAYTKAYTGAYTHRAHGSCPCPHTDMPTSIRSVCKQNIHTCLGTLRATCNTHAGKMWRCWARPVHARVAGTLVGTRSRSCRQACSTS